MTETVTIGGRFHGPPASGNGGYCCGVVAGYIEGPASVRLHVPPPLEVPMEIRRQDGAVVMVHEGEVIATGRPSVMDIEVPAPPDYAGAERASARYRGFESHFYPGCFVCGPQRQHGDGLRVFAGPVDTGDGPAGMVAATWLPDDSLADARGKVLDRYLWAVLDCPGAYAFPEPASGAILLGELSVDIRAGVAAGQRYIVIGWQVGHDGRKHYTGTALFGEAGECCAVGYATWFEV